MARSGRRIDRALLVVLRTRGHGPLAEAIARALSGFGEPEPGPADPHFTTPAQVERLGTAAGLALESRLGPWIGSFSRLVKPA